MARFLVVLFAVFFTPLTAFAEGPRLEVDLTEFQFGTVLQGDKVEHAFTFRNAGDDVLLIERVKSSCGCTAALVSEKELAPGTEGEVRATFDSTRFRGNIVKTIYLYTNDPARRLVQFHIRGQVKEELVLSTRSLSIGPVPAGGVATAPVTLTNTSDAPITIGPVRTTAKELTTEFVTSPLAPGESMTIELVASPAKGKTLISGYLLVSTDSPRLPEVRIPVQIRVAPAAG